MGAFAFGQGLGIGFGQQQQGATLGCRAFGESLGREGPGRLVPVDPADHKHPRSRPTGIQRDHSLGFQSREKDQRREEQKLRRGRQSSPWVRVQKYFSRPFVVTSS